MASTSTAEESTRKRQDIPPGNDENKWYIGDKQANYVVPYSRYNDSIYKLHIPSGDRNAEIIFFHDIQWTGCKEPHVQSWMSSTEPQVCWPSVWLPAEYPRARILSARYDAGVLKGETAGHMTLHSLAGNLRQDVLSIYNKSCPVFLVGHGLGGLVIKALIRNVQEERDSLAWNGSEEEKAQGQTLDQFLKNVKGILYYAPPFLGTELADLKRMKEMSKCDFWRQFADLWGNSPQSGSMLENVQLLNTETCSLNEWFGKWRRKRGCKTTSVFAVLPTKVPLWCGAWCGHVVKEAAARCDADTFYSSQTDHFTVCKLCDENDSSFRLLKELINPLMQETGKVSITHGEDRDEGACTKLVEDLLSELHTLGRGSGLLIHRDATDKIQEFPKLWEKLIDRLERAGLAKTPSKHMDCESWQPI